MRRRIKGFLNSDEWAKFRQEHEKADDRSCAIVLAAYIDDCLQVLLKAALLKTDKADETLFGDMRPLGSFSAKIRMAHCIGLICDSELHDLHLIREVRNRFAHLLHGERFCTDPIRQWCQSLKMPDELWGGKSDPDYGSYGVGSRNRFTFTCAMLVHYFESYHMRKARVIRTMLENAKPEPEVDAFDDFDELGIVPVE